MKKQKASLSRLEMVLTNARRRLPPRVSKKDANDDLASRLIQQMKTEYKKGPLYELTGPDVVK